MTRMVKRELIARLVSAALVVGPISIGIIAAIFLYTYFDWQGRAGAVVGIGGIITIVMGVIVGAAWEHRSNIVKYPLVYKNSHSWLTDWIEEPEEKPTPKSKPRPGTWKED